MDTELRNKLMTLKIQHCEREIERIYPEYIWAKEQYQALRSDIKRLNGKLRILKHRIKKEGP